MNPLVLAAWIFFLLGGIFWIGCEIWASRARKLKEVEPSEAEGRWRLKSVLENDDWHVYVYDEYGKRVAHFGGRMGHETRWRTYYLANAKSSCDTQLEIESARNAGSLEEWYGTPSVPSLQKKIAQLEAELLDNEHTI